MSESIHRHLKALAEREGISINRLINSAVAEKLAALMTQEYLQGRADRGSRRKLRAVLAKFPTQSLTRRTSYREVQGVVVEGRADRGLPRLVDASAASRGGDSTWVADPFLASGSLG